MLATVDLADLRDKSQASASSAVLWRPALPSCCPGQRLLIRQACKHRRAGVQGDGTAAAHLSNVHKQVHLEGGGVCLAQRLAPPCNGAEQVLQRPSHGLHLQGPSVREGSPLGGRDVKRWSTAFICLAT